MCIEHLYSGDRDGYARVEFRGATIGLHRLVLAHKLGIDPDDLAPVARHTCDNPRCIDENHLVPGTAADNNHDAKERGRSAKGESLPISKLTSQAVADIRANYRKHSKEFGLLHFSTKYGVGISAVHAAIRRETWAS